MCVYIIHYIYIYIYSYTVLPKIQANESGAADAIMLDIDGYVAETNATNLFLVKNSILYTPTTDHCLPGMYCTLYTLFTLVLHTVYIIHILYMLHYTYYLYSIYCVYYIL